MTQQVIDIGSAPDDATGDPLRTSFDKTNDNFTELYAKGATEGLWNYNQTSTDTSTAPVSGRFKTNSGNYRDATQIAIHGITIQVIDRTSTLRTLLVGDLIQCQDKSNAAAWCRYSLQSLPVDHGTWFQLNVTFQADGGVASGDNQEIIFVFTASSGSTAVGAPVGAEYITSTADATLTAERVLTDTATVTWDRTTAGQIKATAVSAAAAVPQRTIHTTGSGTYTTPVGATWLEVELVGGGGGGAGGAGSGATNGGNGITSTFSGLSALGAIGGTTAPAPGAGGGTSGTGVNDVTSTGGSGGNSNNTGQGGVGGSSAFGGQSYSTNPGARGAGGAGGGTGEGYGGGGGGAGGYIRSIITSPVASYSYAVGAGGSAGNGGSPSGGVGAAGNTGIVIVTSHFGG